MNAAHVRSLRNALIWLIVAPQGVTAAVIDQAYDAQAAGSYMAINVQVTQQVAQTFTVGIAGKLVGVDLQVGRWDFDPPTGDLLVDIRPTVDGAPVADDSLALAMVAVPATKIPLSGQVWATGAFTYVDLNGFSISVARGEVLAIALRTTSSTAFYGWVDQAAPLGPTYPGGAQYARRFSPEWGEDVGWDAGFRAHVPEPAALILVFTGLAAAALGTQRHRRVCARAVQQRRPR